MDKWQGVGILWDTLSNVVQLSKLRRISSGTLRLWGNFGYVVEYRRRGNKEGLRCSLYLSWLERRSVRGGIEGGRPPSSNHFLRFTSLHVLLPSALWFRLTGIYSMFTGTQVHICDLVLEDHELFVVRTLPVRDTCLGTKYSGTQSDWLVCKGTGWERGKRRFIPIVTLSYVQSRSGKYSDGKKWIVILRSLHITDGRGDLMKGRFVKRGIFSDKF